MLDKQREEAVALGGQVASLKASLAERDCQIGALRAEVSLPPSLSLSISLSLSFSLCLSLSLLRSLSLSFSLSLFVPPPPPLLSLSRSLPRSLSLFIARSQFNKYSFSHRPCSCARSRSPLPGWARSRGRPSRPPAGFSPADSGGARAFFRARRRSRCLIPPLEPSAPNT